MTPIGSDGQIPAGAAAEVRLVSLPVREHLSTAHDATPPPNRELAIVCIELDGVRGWGECSALNRPTYTAEFARGAYARLSALLTDGSADFQDAPMAAAAVESARLDLQLRAEGVSLASWVAAGTSSVARSKIAAGAALGQASLDELAVRAADLASAGFARIKLKIEPGHVREAVRTVREAAPEVTLHVDGNGSFVASDIAELAGLTDLGVTSFEQPFAPADLSSAAALLARIDVPLVADEAVNSLQDLQVLHAAGALSGLSLKVAKLGGLVRSLAVVAWCRDHGVTLTAGGMLECGLGRHQLAAMAAPEWSSLAGDVSPARRWLSEDPWPDLEMVDGFIATPTGPGIAPEPDQDLLDRFTLERAVS